MILFTCLISIISQMKCYFRKVIRRVQPCVVTRWNSSHDEVKSTNIFMSDVTIALSEMLDDTKGIDRHLLKETSSQQKIDKHEFTFTPLDKMIYRQYECAAEEVASLSRFFQKSGATAHEQLFEIRYCLQELKKPKFQMYSDISHSDVSDLGKRVKCEVVLENSAVDQHEHTMGKPETMLDCIERFRYLFSQDFAHRIGLIEESQDNHGEAIVIDVPSLPTDISVAALLNPLYGGERRMVPALMTLEQYQAAEEELLSRIQKMLECETGRRANVREKGSPGGKGDGMDDHMERPISCERDAAETEWKLFGRLCKMSRYFPKKYVPGSERSLGEGIKIGTVEDRGDDIMATQPFVQCNLASFISHGGHFDLVNFLSIQKECFPNLYKLAVCLASLRTNEVGCERFFSAAGYVSNPRRTSLKVKNYETIAMLKRNMHQVYIDENWVVNRYLTHEKAKDWNAEELAEDKMMFQLEKEIQADSMGIPVAQLQWDDNNEEVKVVDILMNDDIVRKMPARRINKEVTSLSSTSIKSLSEEDQISLA
jgi:hAT family C-terminal dimerisation region